MTIDNNNPNILERMAKLISGVVRMKGGTHSYYDIGIKVCVRFSYSSLVYGVSPPMYCPVFTNVPVQ